MGEQLDTSPEDELRSPRKNANVEHCKADVGVETA